MGAQGQKIAIAGAVSLIAEPAMQMAHFGGPGVIAGLAAGVAAYVIADEIQQLCGRTGEEDVIPSPVPVAHKMQGVSSLGKRLLVGKSVRGNEQPLPQQQTPRMPRRSPTFAHMQHLIEPGKDILGFDGQEFISAESLKQSVNFALIGVPGSGKTTALAFHAGQAIVRGAIVRGWDLHGDVAADLGGVLHILEDVDEIVEDCAWIQAERERRLSLRKRAKAGERQALAQWNATRELFYIVDEFNALMLRLKQRKEDRERVADTLLSLIAEGRKFKMRIILTGQTMPAALFGEGGSSARDIINTKYALQSRPNHAQYFGIEPKAIETLLPLISGQGSEGYAVLDGGPLLHAKLVSIPYTTSDDIRSLLNEYEYEQTVVPETPRRHHAISGYEALQQRKANRKAPVYAAQESVPETPRLSPDEQLAYSTYADGMSWRDLAKQLDWGHDKAYRIRRQLIERGLVTEDSRKL